MTIQEVLKLLAYASAFDERLKPPTDEDAIARATVWFDALDSNMEFQYAKNVVCRHYAEKTEKIMPANINEAWRAYARHLRTIQMQELEAAKPKEPVAPAPPEIMKIINEYKKRIGKS